uniref:Nucleotide exchange factor SIL1 n=1 Tax=Knipowitschia caucasica TaxID=637954 RepID=A0AAV2MKI2_KNICA
MSTNTSSETGCMAPRLSRLTCLRLSIMVVLLFHCSYTFCQRKRKHGWQKVDDEDDENEVQVEDEEVLELVHPTNKWQSLKPGQAVPRGSHVRLNLQTGQREVRLGEDQLKYWNQQHSENDANDQFINPDELKEAMKKIKEDLKINQDSTKNDSPSSHFRPLEELKEDMAQLNLLVETDAQILRRLLTQLNSTRSTEEKLTILYELEYMVHQVDNAQNLCSMGGLLLLLEGLNSSDSKLQETSAFVLGSALSSNPTVQVKAVESGVLQTLLMLLATTENVTVQKKVLFAIVSLLRNFPFAQQHFLSNGGLQVMSEVFQGDGNRILQTRIVTLLHDLISEREQISKTKPDSDPSHEERLHQYSRVSLDKELVETNWCSLVPQLLNSPEHDHREKALLTLLAMAPLCVEQFGADQSLQTSLISLKTHYEEILHKEKTAETDGGYFQDIRLSHCSAMGDGEVMEMAALGRPFNLGMLYDCRADRLVPGITLWDIGDLMQDTRVAPKPNSEFHVVASESISDKSSSMGVEASVKASFLGGLIEVEDNIEHNSVTLSFSAPSFGVETIKTYRVEYCVDGAEEWEQTETEGDQVTVTGLSPNTEYSFRVRAVTDVGVGPAAQCTGNVLQKSDKMFRFIATVLSMVKQRMKFSGSKKRPTLSRC